MGIGLFRLILSLTVIIAHTGPIFNFTIGSAVIAVRSFFIISGFYMGMILNEKYRHFGVFIWNRFLRLFPMYFTILLLTILASYLAHRVNNNWGDLTYYVDNYQLIKPLSFIVIILSNIFIFGRDILLLTVINPLTGLLSFAHTVDNGISVSNFLLIPQAWTLALELVFYLLAPFIVRLKVNWVVMLFLISFAIKYYIGSLNLNSVVLNYRFFPIEMEYFILGVLSYKIYFVVKSKFSNQKVNLGAIILIFCMYSFIGYLPDIMSVSFNRVEWMYYALLTTGLPFMFLYSKNLIFDRKLGDLSYPIYISHVLINNVANSLIFTRFASTRSYSAIIVFTLSVLISVIMLKYIQNPIEKYRQKRANREIKLANQLALS